jgi:hypothetical protein
VTVDRVHDLGIWKSTGGAERGASVLHVTLRHCVVTARAPGVGADTRDMVADLITVLSKRGSRADGEHSARILQVRKGCRSWEQTHSEANQYGDGKVDNRLHLERFGSLRFD